MGFHIINIKNGKLTHSYAANEGGLARIEIEKDSIIYQGEPHWSPEIIKNSEKYACWAEPWYRAGIV